MVKEIPLSGGNVSTQVVRIEETVRKPPTPFDPAVTALLERFEKGGIAGVPRTRGGDAQGRRILTWLPGATDFPDRMWTDLVTLKSAARLLRVIHDASVPLVGQDHRWAITTPGAPADIVIGHSDFAPYNMVFRSDGTVTGVFDFDLAGPAPRGRDLAYLAWWMVPLGQQDIAMAAATARDVEDGSPRLKELCHTYGHAADDALLDMVAQVLDHMGDARAIQAMTGETATAKLQAEGHLAHWQRAAADFSLLRPRVTANLGRSGQSR